MRTDRLRMDQDKTVLPLVLTGARMSSENDGFFRKDVQVCEDPLPAIVETTKTGYSLPRDSRFTRVAGETNDDR